MGAPSDVSPDRRRKNIRLYANPAITMVKKTAAIAKRILTRLSISPLSTLEESRYQICMREEIYQRRRNNNNYQAQSEQVVPIS